MVTQPDDFFSDLQEIETQRQQPQIAPQAVPPTDFFSDLEAVQAQSQPPPSKITQLPQPPLQRAQNAAEQSLQAPPRAPEKSQSKIGDFFSDLQEIESQHIAQQPEQQARQTKFPFLPATANVSGKVTPEVEKKQSRLIESFKEGIKESASGELAQLAFGEFQQMAESGDKSFFESLVHESSTVLGDLPFLAAGGTLGASLGAALGAPAGPFGAGAGAIILGGAGAMSVSTFLKESIKEYRDYARKGNESLTYGEFIERAGRVGSKSLNSGIMGAILGMTQKAMPLLKQVPGLGKLFETKAAQVGGKVVMEAGVMTAVPALAENRLPEKEDFARALALFAGFSLLHMPGNLLSHIEETGTKSGLEPSQWAERYVKERPAEVEKIRNVVEKTGKAFEENAYKEAKQEQLPPVAEKPKAAEQKPAEKPEFEVAETRGTGKQFHGSPTELKGVDKWYYNPLNYYGQGFYTTEAADVAKGYSNRRIEGKKNPTIYEVTPNHDVKLLDMETPLTEVDPKAMGVINEISKGQYGTAPIVAMALEENPKNLRELYDGIRDVGTAEGHSAAEIQEAFEGIQVGLEKLGYHGLTHIGGLKTGKKPHTVRIYFDPEADLSIKKTELPLRRKVKPEFTESMLKNAEKLPFKSEAHKKEFIEKVNNREIGNVEEVNAFLRGKVDFKHPAEKLTFTTEKGSTYEVNPDGTTTRNKAARAGAEHVGDEGLKSKSDKTWYVSPEDANRLSLVKTLGGEKRIFQFPDGKIGVQYLDGKSKGNVESGTVIEPQAKPAVGLIPLEIWKEGRESHFGNKITEVKAPKAKATELPKGAIVEKPAEAKQVPETKIESLKLSPLVETTGQGAGARIEYPKTGMAKLIEKMNSFIEEAKTPIQSLKRRGEAVNMAIFNALAPLEKLEANIPVAERVSSRIKFAKSAASEINSVLENGIFSNITGNFEHGGLKEAYGELSWKKLTKGLKPHEYSIEDLDIYRTSKAALKRQREGKKTGIDTVKATEDVNQLKDKYEPIDKRIRDFQKATLETYGKDLLGKELIEQWNRDYYSPLYRVMDSGKDSILAEGSLTPKQPFKKMVGSGRKIIPPSESDPYNTAMLVRNARKNDAVLQYMKLVTKGELPGRIKASKSNPIPESAFEALGVDPDMKPVAENLYNQTRKEAFTPEKNTLRGWSGGKAFEIEVPEEVYNVFSTLVPSERSPITKLVGAVNRIFSRGISMEPRKFVSIVSRDALSSLIYSRTGSNPVSIFEALADVYNGSPVYREFLAMGGDVYASKLAERIDRTRKIEDLITPGKEGILVPFEKMGDYFRKYGHVLSNISLAVPLAEYKRALEVHGNTPEGRIMAAMEARRVVYDPGRKGSSKIVQGFGNYVPFWNVSLQDISMVGENLKRAETWMKGAAAIALPTLMLKMMNDGNPDYEELTPIDKAAFWHIFSGDQHIRIPIPWLLGTTFKVGTEAFFDTTTDLWNKGDPRAKDAWKGLYDHFFENVSGAVPPALQVYMEQTAGKTVPSPLGYFFGAESKAPEVVPRRLQGLEPRHQYTSKTSQVAKKWGELWNVSPVKVERFIKGLGGNTASSVLALTDEIAYFTGMAEDKRPEQKEANYLLLGHFVRNSAPNRTKYQNEFYEYLRQAEQHKKSRKLISQKGLDESLDEIGYESVPLGKYQRKIGKLFRNMRNTEDDDSLSPSLKKSYLDSLQREVNELYKQGVEEVRAAKAGK